MSTCRTFRCRVEQLERRDLLAGLATDAPSLADCLAPRPVGPDLADEMRQISAAEAVPEAIVPLSSVDYGEISVQFIRDVIVIRGDAGNNHISLYGSTIGDLLDGSGNIPSSVTIYVHQTRVTGLDNHQGSLFFQKVKGIDIDLGDGDDYVSIEGGLNGPLTIRGGAGNDEIVLYGNKEEFMVVGWNSHHYDPRPLPVNGDLLIEGGSGDDLVLPWVKVTGDASVQLGDGNDHYLEVPYRSSSINEFLGKPTATGELTIDLGADQDLEVIPEDWHTDPDMGLRVRNILPVLEHYQQLVAQGEVPSGEEYVFVWPETGNKVRFDAQGRLDVNFGFNAGSIHMAERLIARGIDVTAYGIGGGTAWIGMNDIPLLANLPGVLIFSPQGVPDENTIFLTPAPAYGPARPTDAPPQSGTLFASYYRGRVYGPLLLS